MAASETLRPFVERHGDELDADDAFAAEVMRRNGVPSETARALQALGAAFRAWGAHTVVDRVLDDGDRIELAGRTLDVALRPGHSPSDTVFGDLSQRLLIGGDHLLKDVSSNPLIARPPRGEDRPQALVAYLESLQCTRAMDLDLILPGHGDPVCDHRALIDTRRLLPSGGPRRSTGSVSERPRSAQELAVALRGDSALTQTYLTLSEVLGHTDMLVNGGRIREQESAGVVRFVAAE